MDAARRKAYLSALGIEAWSLAAATQPQVEAAVIAEPATAALAPFPASTSMPPVKQSRAPLAVAATPKTAAAAPFSPPADWPGLQATVASCTRCKLCQTRTNTVFGVGSAAAPLMVIGEGPGADEDARGEPFVGRAGKLLDEMLRAIGRSRTEAAPEKAVFIANVVKCRPPGNRDPEPDEVEACRPYLDAQIAQVRPKLIVALGRIAAQRLLASDVALSKLRGSPHVYGAEATPVFVTYHPAYLLRSPGEKAKSWVDLKQVHRFLADSERIR